MNNNKRILTAAALVAAVLGCFALGPNASRLALAMNNTTVKGMSTIVGSYTTTTISSRAVTLYGVFLQPNSYDQPVVYLDCFNTSSVTLGTTKPVVEFLATNTASASHGSPYFFPGGLPLGGTALKCAAVTTSHGTATVSANVSLFWQ